MTRLLFSTRRLIVTSLSCSNMTSTLRNGDYKNLILRFGVSTALFLYSHFFFEIGAMNVVYVKEFKQNFSVKPESK